MKFIFAILAIFVIMILTILFASSGVSAHSWYEKECCDIRDCSEVTNTVELENGDLEISSKYGTVLVPKKFPRRPSQDVNEHICMIPNYANDGWESQRNPSKYNHIPICYYVPLGS